jgi:hypothetical protein
MSESEFYFIICAILCLISLILIINLIQHLYIKIPKRKCENCGALGSIGFVKHTTDINKISRKETTYHFKCSGCQNETKYIYCTKYKVR